MADEVREPVGVDGCLVFFILSVLALGLRFALELLTLFLRRDSGFEMVGGGWMDLEIGELLLSILAIGLCVLIVFRVWSERNWATVQFVVAALWALCVGKTVLDVLLFSWAGFDARAAGGGIETRLLGGALFAAAWTAYFLRSRRVANTYPREEESEAVSDGLS